MAPAVVERTARIIDGRSSLSSRLPAGIRSQIASRCGTLHSYTLFTGYRQQRIRGEMRAFQVLPPQVDSFPFHMPHSNRRLARILQQGERPSRGRGAETSG